MKFKQKSREEQVEADGTESEKCSEDMAYILFNSVVSGLLLFPLQLTLSLGFWKMFKFLSSLSWLLVLKIILSITILM